MQFETTIVSGANRLTRLSDEWEVSIAQADLVPFVGQPAAIEVRAIGDFATSHPAIITTSL